MQKSLSRIREEQQRSGDKQGPDISFDLMATAYRRKRLMEGLMSGDREAQNQILTMATSQLQEAEAAAAASRRVPGERQRGAKAKSLQAQLAEAGFGPAERAVVKKMALALPPAELAQDTRDLEQLTRFGFPRLRGLRHAHADLVVQTVRPPHACTPGHVCMAVRRARQGGRKRCGCGAWPKAVSQPARGSAPRECFRRSEDLGGDGVRLLIGKL